VIRLSYHPPGTPPATLVPRAASRPSDMPLSLIQYDRETITEANYATFEELKAAYDPTKVNWVNVDGLGDLGLLKQVADFFGIHPLAMEDVLNTSQRPKLERFQEHFFIVSEMIYFQKEDSLSVEQLSLFLGEAYVVTLQEECGTDVFDQVRSRLRSGRGFARQRKSDYLAYALLDAAVDQLFPVLEVVADGIEELEDQLIAKPSRETVRRIYELKRLLLQLRRAAWPHREIFNNLLRDDSGLVRGDTQIFLRDCYDHVTQIMDLIENYRDLIGGLMDFYLTSLGFRTNEIMRVLTVISSIFIPLTFLAGVYGMNFDRDHPWNMPELGWPYGYVAFWVVCLISAGSMVAFFKRRHWL